MNCKTCKSFVDGRCYEKFYDTDTVNMVSVVEEGYVDAAVEEALDNQKYGIIAYVKMLIDGLRISKKDKGILINRVNDTNDLRDVIGDYIWRCLDSYKPENNDGIEILNPREFYCSLWR